VETKVCTKCGRGLPLSSFDLMPKSKDGRKGQCKECRSTEAKARRARLKLEDPTSLKIRDDKQNEKHKEKHKISRDKRKDLKAEYDKAYLKNNRPKKMARQLERQRERLQSDPGYRLIRNYRRRVHHALKGQSKNTSTRKLVGCSLQDWWEWLQQGFSPEMTHDNCGQIWQVDHIMPLSSFDLSKHSEITASFHYTNTQPLLIPDNLSKSDKMPWDWTPPTYALKNPALLKILDDHKTEECYGK
jgi:hypothetical protein